MVPARPRRIISLCPSLTETLFALGLADAVVGRTRYCIHPAQAVADVAVVGGTKQIDMDAVAALQPDLIIAEKEENRRQDVEALAASWPVYVLDIRDLAQARAAISTLGELCDAVQPAGNLLRHIEQAWQHLPVLPSPPRVLYLIWRKPWMAAGADTYIDAVLAALGMDNLARQLPGRYPDLGAEQLGALQADLCLLSSEPFPFDKRHIDELRALMPSTRFELVDGEMFSWYGSRMLTAAPYLAQLTAKLGVH